MEKIDYQTLYKLQDRMLQLIFNLDNGFYLTGGTALHRFYYKFRYSDDLDFFSCNEAAFSEDIRELLYSLESRNIIYKRTIQARDFHRIIIDDVLQTDFVNDRIYRYGKSNIINGFRIDNIINILTNKISAIINRDEEKDIFDIIAISRNEPYNWGEILEIAHRKEPFDKLFLIQRLRSFPLVWLSNIKTIKSLEINKDTISIICDDIIKESDNSLYK